MPASILVVAVHALLPARIIVEAEQDVCNAYTAVQSACSKAGAAGLGSTAVSLLCIRSMQAHGFGIMDGATMVSSCSSA